MDRTGNKSSLCDSDDKKKLIGRIGNLEDELLWLKLRKSQIEKPVNLKKIYDELEMLRKYKEMLEEVGFTKSGLETLHEIITTKNKLNVSGHAATDAMVKAQTAESVKNINPFNIWRVTTSSLNMLENYFASKLNPNGSVHHKYKNEKLVKQSKQYRTERYRSVLPELLNIGPVIFKHSISVIPLYFGKEYNLGNYSVKMDSKFNLTFKDKVYKFYETKEILDFEWSNQSLLIHHDWTLDEVWLILHQEMIVEESGSLIQLKKVRIDQSAAEVRSWMANYYVEFPITHIENENYEPIMRELYRYESLPKLGAALISRIKSLAWTEVDYQSGTSLASLSLITDILRSVPLKKESTYTIEGIDEVFSTTEYERFSNFAIYLPGGSSVSNHDLSPIICFKDNRSTDYDACGIIGMPHPHATMTFNDFYHTDGVISSSNGKYCTKNIKVTSNTSDKIDGVIEFAVQGSIPAPEQWARLSGPFEACALGGIWVDSGNQSDAEMTMCEPSFIFKAGDFETFKDQINEGKEVDLKCSFGWHGLGNLIWRIKITNYQVQQPAETINVTMSKGDNKEKVIICNGKILDGRAVYISDWQDFRSLGGLERLQWRYGIAWDEFIWKGDKLKWLQNGFTKDKYAQYDAVENISGVPRYRSRDVNSPKDYLRGGSYVQAPMGWSHRNPAVNGDYVWLALTELTQRGGLRSYINGDEVKRLTRYPIKWYWPNYTQKGLSYEAASKKLGGNVFPEYLTKLTAEENDYYYALARWPWGDDKQIIAGMNQGFKPKIFCGLMDDTGGPMRIKGTTQTVSELIFPDGVISREDISVMDRNYMYGFYQAWLKFNEIDLRLENLEEVQDLLIDQINNIWDELRNINQRIDDLGEVVQNIIEFLTPPPPSELGIFGTLLSQFGSIVGKFFPLCGTLIELVGETVTGIDQFMKGDMLGGAMTMIGVAAGGGLGAYKLSKRLKSKMKITGKAVLLDNKSRTSISKQSSKYRPGRGSKLVSGDSKGGSVNTNPNIGNSNTTVSRQMVEDGLHNSLSSDTSRDKPPPYHSLAEVSWAVTESKDGTRYLCNDKGTIRLYKVESNAYRNQLIKERILIMSGKSRSENLMDENGVAGMSAIEFVINVGIPINEAEEPLIELEPYCVKYFGGSETKFDIGDDNLDRVRLWSMAMSRMNYDSYIHSESVALSMFTDRDVNGLPDPKTVFEAGRIMDGSTQNMIGLDHLLVGYGLGEANSGNMSI